MTSDLYANVPSPVPVSHIRAHVFIPPLPPSSAAMSGRNVLVSPSLS